MDKDELIRRQKDIVKILGAKPDGSDGERSINQKQRKRLNEELREINTKLRGIPGYRRKSFKPHTARKKRKKKRPATKPPPKPQVSHQEGYRRIKELVERHCELQVKLETTQSRSTKQLLREELAATEVLIQEYEPYLEGYKVVRKKKTAKGSGQWITIWQGGAPQ